MSIPFKKFGYKLNPITREIETPQIFLVTKQLKKIGELYPIQDLRITINEANQPDEVSFTYYKEADGKPCSCFDDLVDLSVIQVGDYGFFEIAISKNENSSIVKTVTAQSLGHCELSQILATLEINTDDDMGREGEYRYDANYPTVFYRDISINDNEEIQKKKKESSLLDRILSYSPHYKIGYVSPTLKNVQRTFSWNDTDLVSILNDVATEISCMFDIQVTINEEGEAERILNAYDMQYCDTCWKALSNNEKMTSDTHEFRNIVNGECQNCHSSESVKDIGLDTGIFISTDNLSDDITIVGDKDSIKNCFKVVGGDDLITATVQGLNMSANNRIMMFSEEQRKQMTTALTSKLDAYETAYAENLPAYEELLETQYNIYDMVQYLQSGKMPLLEEEIKTPLEALLAVVKNITTYYENHFYISRWSNYDYTSAKSSIRNLFTTFMPKGFSFRLDTDNLLYATDKDYDSKKTYHWYGSIQIYSTDNKEDYVTLYVTQNSGTYIRQGKTDEMVSYTDPGNIIGDFSVMFRFADQKQSDYMSYLKQHTEYILSEVDLTYENEKARNWDEYSYNRLESYYDGFQTCIETLDDMPNEIDSTKIDTSTTSSADIIAGMRDNYARIQSHIQSQMSILLDQIFALNTYLGEYSSEFTDANGNVRYQLKNFDSVSEVLAHMTSTKYRGGYKTEADGTETFTPNQFIGTKPCKCKKCGSINVSVVTGGSNKCNNCGSSEVFTYLDIIQEIKASYEKNKVQHPKSSIADMRNEMRKKFDLPSYIDNDAVYHELLSFIREDVYTNDNYTSDGLTNAQLIRQAKELTAKAKQELSKACVPQYTVTAPICAIVGQTAFKYQGVMVEDPYSGFVLNNYVHVRIDDEVYRMRIASISYSFPITDKIEVTFSNVSRYNNGVLSDVASILESAASMATSYSYVATQAEKGQQANDTFDTIKNEGLNAGLMAVKGGRDQDVVIDNHGILLRKKIEEIDDYSKYQMKIINRNIVLTDNNWDDAKMAIGLGTYTVEGKQQLVYGVWADLICGDLLAGNKLKIYGGGDGTTDNATVIIDGKGITLDGGAIKWINKGVMDNVEVYYAVSSNGKTPPSEDSPEWETKFAGELNNNYLWSKTVTTYTVGEPTVTYNCLGNSPDGVKSTRKQYCLSKSETSLTSLEWLDYQPTWIGSDYVWTRTHIEYISGKDDDTDPIYDNELTQSLRNFTNFKANIDKCLEKPIPTTEITEDYVFSPKIGGGYLYITDKNRKTKTSVEINPNGTNFGNGHNEDYVFNVARDNDVVMGVTNDGHGYFKGKITATSGYIGGENGWEITGNSIQNTNPKADASIMTGDISSDSSNGKGTLINKGDIINGGDDGTYKLAWIHNGAIDLYRQPRTTSRYRTVITSDVIQGINDSGAWFYVNNIDGQLTVSGTTKFNSAVNFNAGLRLYKHDGSTDFCLLSTTFTGNSESDAHLVAQSSMSIQHKLQVGYNDGLIHPGYTFNVNGSSYFTGDISVNEIKIRTETTSTEAANARFTTGSNPGHIRRSTASSKRYKHDITTTLSNDLDPHKLYDVDVVQYKYNKDYLGKDDVRYNKNVIGFIAEDIYKKYPIAADVTKKDNKEIPEDWNFRFILPAMLKLIQEQKQEIDNLKQLISELKYDSKSE